MQIGKYATQVVCVLVVVGGTSLAVRYRVRHDVVGDLSDTAWRVTYDVECEARRAGSVLQIASPADTARCRVFRQDFRPENLRINPRGRSTVSAWEVVAVAERAGRCESTLRFDLRLNPRGNWPTNDTDVTLTANERARYLRATADVQVHDQVVSGVLATLRNGIATGESLVPRLFLHCREKIAVEPADAASDAATVLAEGCGTPTGCARAMIALCRAAKIPARPVAGFVVEEEGEAAAHVWVEVLIGDRWVVYDPVNGYEKELPTNFVPARRGDDRVVLAKGVRDLEVEYEITRLPRSVLGAGATGQQLGDILDLTRLPLTMQQVLSLVMLMPLGALVTCFFRNIVGLKTSGTFTPTLLALSLVFADWKVGLVILAATLVLGIATRFLIDRLKLLILPRLSIMLTLVVFCIVFGVSALEYFRLAPGTQAVLLPMVIVTMLVERFYITAQEDGPSDAVQHLAGTLIVGFFCALVLCWDAVARLLLAYPEAHCFTVAMLMVIGRYTGYQLLESLRFRDFADLKT